MVIIIFTLPAAFPPRKATLVLVEKESGEASEPVWTF
jgi:hypothetical protein